MRENILGNKIIELLKAAKRPLTVWQISKSLGVNVGQAASTIAHLTFSEPLAENDNGGIYLMERDK
jgi:hypothetical protein